MSGVSKKTVRFVSVDSCSSGSDRKKKLQENKITHILSIHDNAEPEFTVSISVSVPQGAWPHLLCVM